MSDTEQTELSLSEAWQEDRLAILALALCFVISHMLAMYIVPAYEEAEVQAFENPDDPLNSVVYIGIILVFTAFILWIAKQGLEWLLQLIFLSAIGVTFIYVFYPFFSYRRDNWRGRLYRGHRSGNRTDIFAIDLSRMVRD